MNYVYYGMLQIPRTARITTQEVVNTINVQLHLPDVIIKRKILHFGHIVRHRQYEILKVLLEGNVEEGVQEE